MAGFRKSRRIRIAKGVSLNVSKSGISTSAKIGRVTLNSRRGATVNVAKGVSYNIPAGGKSKSGTTPVKAAAARRDAPAAGIPRYYRRPWRMPAWLFWTGGSVGAILLGSIPFAGPLLAIVVIGLLVVFWLKSPKLLAKEASPAPAAPTLISEPSEQPKARLEVTLSGPSGASMVKLSGTTTFAKEAITALAARHGAGDDGYLEFSGTVQREPDNPADSQAVAVHVEGERIGYLPSYVASTIDLSDSGARAVPVQIFTEELPKGLRAEAWAWLAEGAPNWEFSRDNRPPMSPRARAQAHHEGVNEMVTSAVAGGGGRAEQFKSGMVNGVHHLQLVEPIKQLKREARLEDALTLCYAAIDGAESAAARERLEPAPWYTEQAAIIHRKLGQHDLEVAVLERWIAACPPDRRGDSRIKERLDKLQS